MEAGTTPDSFVLLIVLRFCVVLWVFLFFFLIFFILVLFPMSNGGLRLCIVQILIAPSSGFL